MFAMLRLVLTSANQRGGTRKVRPGSVRRSTASSGRSSLIFIVHGVTGLDPACTPGPPGTGSVAGPGDRHAASRFDRSAWPLPQLRCSAGRAAMTGAPTVLTCPPRRSTSSTSPGPEQTLSSDYAAPGEHDAADRLDRRGPANGQRAREFGASPS